MNKLAVCLVCFALAACAPTDPPTASYSAATAAARDPARGGARPGVWHRAEAERNGAPIAWEFRADVDAARRATLPQLVVVSVVNYVDVGEDKRLKASTIDAYDRIERDLAGLMAGKGELVAVLDHYRQYDWYFYATDVAGVDAIRALFAQSGYNGVTVEVENDAQGEFYATLRERVDAR